MTKTWLTIATYYNRQVSDMVLRIYADDCKNYTVEQIRGAWRVYRTTKEAKFFPVPAVLINIIDPPANEDAEINAVPAAIFQAIRSCGYMNPNEAREQMGELSWSVVCAMGGWNHLCSSTNLGNDGTVRAQVRDMARSRYVRHSNGRSGLKPGENLREIFANIGLDVKTIDGAIKKRKVADLER